MFITTKAEFTWDKDLKKYVEVHTEGYEYEGELAFALGGNWDSFLDSLVPDIPPSTSSTPSTPSSPFGSVAEAYHTGSSDTTWGDITKDLDVNVPEEYQQYLWEYDPYKEEAIRAGAYGDIGGQYADARTQMMKTRQPSKAGGSFAGAGSSLLDMTTQDLYEDVGRGTRGTMLDMMTDITEERTGYREDITQRLMDIQNMRGEEFKSLDPEEWSYDQCYDDCIEHGGNGVDCAMHCSRQGN